MLQLTSTVLLSDFGTGVLRSFAHENSVLYNYIFPPSSLMEGALPSGEDWVMLNTSHYPLRRRTTTWLRNPPVFPAFAEYSVPVKSERQNVDDTGVLLRAFLPYADATLRQSISEFEGKTIVLDARVSCQRPRLEHLSASEQGASFAAAVDSTVAPESFTAVQINGIVAPSETNVDKLVSGLMRKNLTRTT